MKPTYLMLLLTILLASCKPDTGRFPLGSFGHDQQFIGSYDKDLLVLSLGEARVLVSAKFQGKVFTSSAEGDKGQSFGWINYKGFGGTLDAHMNAYGGENRLWLGPEGGPFSLFFKKGEPMVFDHWKTPAAFDSQSWMVSAHSQTQVRLLKVMKLQNYAGTELLVKINREIELLSSKSICDLLHIGADPGVKMVGYQTVNAMTNAGKVAWDERTGMPCMWLLDMFPPSGQTTIVVPYRMDEQEIKPATTNYFGEIPADRIRMKGDVLYFKADGKHRSKLGMHPKKAKNVAGSWDGKNEVLTITLFDVDNQALYLNQQWSTSKAPFSGDAVNAYNDGLIDNIEGGKQLGPFYELESVSPAAFLKPGERQVHHHAVFHFCGERKSLDQLSRKVLGVSLDQIENALQENE